MCEGKSESPFFVSLSVFGSINQKQINSQKMRSLKMNVATLKKYSDGGGIHGLKTFNFGKFTNSLKQCIIILEKLLIKTIILALSVSVDFIQCYTSLLSGS